MVAANRDLLAAIAGVFFLLPGLIGALILPTPTLTRGMNDQQMTDAVTRFYSEAGPQLILLSLPMIVGFMTMLGVLLDSRRPTVGATIGRSVRRLPVYLAAHILTTLGLSALFVFVATLLIGVLPPVGAIVAALLVLVWPMARLVLVAPEIVLERVRNPFLAILRSWRLTRGRTLAILLYFGPALTLFLVVYGLVMIFVGVVLVQTTEGEAQRMLAEGIVGVLFATAYTYFAAMIASTYSQLGDRHEVPAA